MTERSGRLADHADVIDGARLFHEGRFWDAHEAWERVWIAEKGSPRGRFVQGLIQLAAAMHKLLVMRNAANAAALLGRARAKIAEASDRFEGFEVASLLVAIDACAEEVARVSALGDVTAFDRSRVPRVSTESAG